MKKYFLSGLLMGSLVCGLAYAQEVTDQKIQQDQAQLKADYQKKADHDLKRLGRRIRHLKHRTDAQVNADLKDATLKLEAQKADVDKQLKALGNSTGDAWADLRKGVDKALKDLKVSVDQASEQFETKSTPAGD